jgi:RNA polymerase sigma-70 factor (ECF subfamily)
MMLAMDQIGDVPQVLHMKDEEVLRLSQKSPSLFAEIMRRYEEAFLRKAQSVLKNKEDAEDVVQEAFTKIYLNAASFEVQEGASFKSWGYAILMNTAFTLYKKKKKNWERNEVLDPEWYEALPDLESRQFEKQELSDYVVSLFSRMPEHFVRMLKFQYLEGLSQEEIAAREGLTVGAVKTRMHRAKKALAAVTEKEEESI